MLLAAAIVHANGRAHNRSGAEWINVEVKSALGPLGRGSISVWVRIELRKNSFQPFAQIHRTQCNWKRQHFKGEHYPAFVSNQANKN